MEEIQDINQLQYVQDRQPLLELTEEEQSIRRPSTEQQQKDRGTLLLLRYNRLQAGLAQRRSDIWKVVEFNDVDENGIITLKAFNSGKFTALQKEIHDYLRQIATIEEAFKALAKINAPFDGDISKQIQVLDHKIREKNSELDKMKHSTRVEDYIPKIKLAEKELGVLEKELSKVQVIKAKMNDVFDGLMVMLETSRSEAITKEKDA